MLFVNRLPILCQVQEYILGRFDKAKFDELVAAYDKDVAEGITRHPPTKRLEGINMPYYELTMDDGTQCDLNSQPRKTRVMYVCYPGGNSEVYQLKVLSGYFGCITIYSSITFYRSRLHRELSSGSDRKELSKHVKNFFRIQMGTN